MSDNILDRRWPWLVAAGVIVAAFLLSTIINIDGGNPEARTRQLGTIEDITALRERDDTNLLFILVDTLRSDRLGSYGYSRNTSPYLDELASTGVRLDRHLSQASWTKASMASLWTSLYPWRTGITRFDDVIPDAAELPAETLKQAGFRTIGIWRNGWVDPRFGFSQGFDVYTRPPGRRFRKDVLAQKPSLKQRGTDEDVTTSAIEFLRVHSGGRWFLYLHMMDLHEYTYDEQSALFGTKYSDVYDNSIRWVDETLRIFMEHLADQGYAENTIVVITSDHGEAFMERGFEGHGRRLYKETTEVPFLVRFPFKLEPGVVVETRTQNIDMWPTLFDLLGVAAPPDRDGRSLVPDIIATARNESPPTANQPALSYLDRHWGRPDVEPDPTVAVADGPLRYVRAKVAGKVVEDLFDASNDPLELENIASTSPETVERLRTVADRELASEPAWGEAPTREIGEMELNQLRAIGYDIGK